MATTTKSQRLQNYENAHREERRKIQQSILTRLQELKAKHPDAIVLFRFGDFYQVYNSDAVALAQTCGLIINRREVANDIIESAGFPHHELDTYFFSKLVRAGHRDIIVEQI